MPPACLVPDAAAHPAFRVRRVSRSLTVAPPGFPVYDSSPARPRIRVAINLRICPQMSPTPVDTIAFSALQAGQFADTFALLATRDEAKTRDDKPYYRVTFRDADRAATAMIWTDHALFAACRDQWQVGGFYKLRCRYTESNWGPQIEIDRIREVTDADREQGFDPDTFYPTTRFDREAMFTDLQALARDHIPDEPLRDLVSAILTEHAAGIMRHSAAVRNHHAFIGGYLEHTLSVARTAVFLADKYRAYYTKMRPPLSKSLVVAGAILHDIGKLHELEFRPGGWEYTARGRLIGHIQMGRDLVREFAARIPGFSPDDLLRLEHIILSHQNLPEWGSPIPPSTPEALLVYFADDMDAKFHELAVQLETPWPPGTEFTTRNNPLRRMIFLGLNDREP